MPDLVEARANASQYIRIGAALKNLDDQDAALREHSLSILHCIFYECYNTELVSALVPGR